MSIAFTCSSCGKKYTVKDEFAGKRVKCAACNNTMVLPAAGAKKTLPPAEKTAPKVVAPKEPVGPVGSIFDELEPEGSSAPSGGKVVMAGHILQPQLDPSEIDEFELEPPAKVKIDVGVFLDDDPGTSPEPKKKPAAGKGATKPVKKGPAPAAGDDSDLTVAEDPHDVPPPPEPTVPCPGCGQGMKPNSVLCIHCGLDLRTGEKIEGAKKSGFGKLFGGLKREK
jgi:ribosomal protein S27E